MKTNVKISGLLAVALLLGACSLNKVRDSATEVNVAQSGSYEQTRLPMKDFEILGMVVVTSKVTYDVNGDKNGSEITNAMLLREAAKLGGDDVINVRIDKRDTTQTHDSYRYNGFTNDEEFMSREHYARETTYTATALAIKYTNTILPQCPKAAPAPEPVAKPVTAAPRSSKKR